MSIASEVRTFVPLGHRRWSTARIHPRASCAGDTCTLPRKPEFLRAKLRICSFLQDVSRLCTVRIAGPGDITEMNTHRIGGVRIQMMGGGPRTYPGGAKKWQWKRRERKDMQVLKKARQSREQKLFLTRRRQELSMDSGILIKPNQDSGSEWGSRESFSGNMRLEGPAEPCRDREHDRVSGESGGQRRDWIGSRLEVEKQIQRVQDRLSEQYRRPTGPVEEDARSFSQLSLSPSTLKALNNALDIYKMTQVQEAALPPMLTGYDLLAQTSSHGEDIVASLVLAIELILKRVHDQAPLSGLAKIQLLTVSGRHPVTALLICPTQDSVSLVASIAKRLAIFHRSIRVQIIRGGDDVRKEINRLRNFPCEILVATPGRILHHLQQSAEFRGQLGGLKLFAIHEGQRLLDMGYGRTVEQISRCLPRSRQTLLWSPSQTDKILALSHALLKSDRKDVRLRQPGGVDVTYQMAPQQFIIVSVESHLSRIYTLLKDHAAKVPNFKAIVFCQTVRATTLTSEVFKCIGFHTREIHVRKNEKQKELVLAEFRAAKGGIILCTSGASVWRAGFPDVTLVLQIGPPAAKQQYFERVTLSGQEMRTVDCLLLLMPHQVSFLEELLPLSLQEIGFSEEDKNADAKVRLAVLQVNSQIRAKAYVAWLRYHIARNQPHEHPWEVLQHANMYSAALGFREPPHLNSKTKKALGLDVDVQEVTSALHDNCRAILVKNRTLGKGLIQSGYELGNGSELSLTVGKYVTPGKVDIDGIEADSQSLPGL